LITWVRSALAWRSQDAAWGPMQDQVLPVFDSEARSQLGLRALPATAVDDYIAVTRASCDKFRKQNSDTPLPPVFAAGHSLGGLVGARLQRSALFLYFAYTVYLKGNCK
jgi:hypothetical protein